jgi:hypothetical protein
MDIFTLDNNRGYQRAPLLDLVNDQDEIVVMMWEHCVAGIGNGEIIYDTRTNRARITAMAEAHNWKVEFLSPLKNNRNK